MRQDEKKAASSYLLIYGIPEASSYPHLAHALRGEEAAHVLLPEMRPELWGLHTVAQGLREQNVPFQLVSDNMMGTLFAQGTIRKLYLFYTEFAEKGPVGICGSLLAVLLARAHGVPVKLFASKAVAAAPRDRDVSTFMGQRVGSDGVEIYPIEKEMIPWAFFKEKTEV